MTWLLPGRTAPPAGVWCKPTSSYETRGEAPDAGSRSSYFYQTAFTTALVLGDREVLCKVTGLSHSSKVVVLLFKDGIALSLMNSARLDWHSESEHQTQAV